MAGNNFAELLEESFKKRKQVEAGARYEAMVTSVKNDYVFVKTKDNIRGIVSVEEFEGEEAVPAPGKEINVFFLKENHGDFYFTTSLAGEDINPENLELAARNEIPVIGQFGVETTGGYDVKIGEFLAFCSYSQIDPELKGKQISGKKFRFIVNETSGKNKKMTVSQKKLADKEKELKRDILRDELKEGSHVTCRIKSIHNFGLIVDMNGFDALVPASEATFKKNINLESEFQIGQTLHGKILSLNWKDDKITVSLKDSSDDPWAKKVPFKEGDIVSATVESLKPFGVFMRLNDHFHALLPNKETGLPPRTPLTGHFHPGDVIEVFVTEVNTDKKQIAVSLAKAKEARDRMDYEKYLNNQPVSNSATSSFGLALQKSLNKKK